MEITFKADKKHRDRYFSAGSFAHPAKMMLPLQRWIIEKYSKPGDVILDPMAGCGTVLIACTMGRHVICVELEQKFLAMQRDNWTKIQTLGPEMGYEMGKATILQGDARKLPDVVITSPPYEGTEARDRSKEVSFEREKSGRYPRRGDLGISSGYQADVIMTSPPYASQWGVSDNNRPKATFDREQRHKERHPDKYRPPLVAYSESMDNIGNLPYGKLADVIMTSPPYEGSDVSQTHMTSDQRGDPSDPNYRPSWKTKLEQGYAETKRPYADCVITSPPYEGITGNGKEIGSEGHATGPFSYGGDSQNIGNLKGESYLSAMLEVYQGCWRVLKPQGLMVLVTKNFIREKQEIRLDLDTIKLCEQAGFQFVERHYRQLTSQSFWRTIYQQKYPDAPILDKEDILVFRKYGV